MGIQMENQFVNFDTPYNSLQIPNNPEIGSSRGNDDLHVTFATTSPFSSRTQTRGEYFREEFNRLKADNTTTISHVANVTSAVSSKHKLTKSEEDMYVFNKLAAEVEETAKLKNPVALREALEAFADEFFQKIEFDNDGDKNTGAVAQLHSTAATATDNPFEYADNLNHEAGHSGLNEHGRTFLATLKPKAASDTLNAYNFLMSKAKNKSNNVPESSTSPTIHISSAMENLEIIIEDPDKRIETASITSTSTSNSNMTFSSLATSALLLGKGNERKERRNVEKQEAYE
jgi:hypothetical protein